MNQNLLILGAGQLGTMAKEIAVCMGCFDRIDFLDDHSALAIGGLADLERLTSDYSHAIVAIGNPEVRLSLIERAEAGGYHIATLIAPDAHIAPSARLGNGTIVEPNATVQTGATVGVGCIISSGAVIRHNAELERGCHVDCNAVVLSGASLPEQFKLAPLTCYPTGNGK